MIIRNMAKIALAGALAASLVPAGTAQQAGADEVPAEGPVVPAATASFSSASGTRGGSTVSCGTTLAFKVLSQPAGGAPGTVQVGDGSSLALSADYTGRVTIPEYVENERASYRVVACGPDSFKYAKITGVSLPDTVTTLDKRCFMGCTSLTDVSLGANSQLSRIYAQAFYAPSTNGSLENIRLPRGLRWIGANAFNGQVALRELHFDGDWLDYLGSRAFANCTGLVKAEIPGFTAEGTGLDFLCFANCTNLETVVFKQSVLKEAEGAALDGNLTEGTRTFVRCGKLSTVVYRGKKYIPSWGSYTAGGSYSYISFMDSDPALYVTVSYYPSRESALRGTGRLGAVCVRSDIPLLQVKPDMETSDKDGTVVYDGSVPQLPGRATGWAYERSHGLTAAVGDSLYAYPVDASDLRYATLDLDRETYDFAGGQVSPRLTLTDAAGKKLSEGTDYTVSYERKTGGSWAATDDLASEGELRAIATARTGSGHTGSASAAFSIARAQEGSTFEKGGVTYRILTAAQVGKPGAVSVGDGEKLAIDSNRTGAMSIPAAIAPEGSSLEYAVTEVADYAFGGASSAGAATGLTGIELPETLEHIGTYAFGHCTGLASANIPARVQSIGARAFDHCSSLANLSFGGSSIGSLGTYAFASCSALKTLVLPSILSSSDHAFASCNMLSRVDFLGSFPDEAVPTRFAGCKRLARVVCHARNYPDALPNGARVYYPVSFRGTTGDSLGTALVQSGTTLSQLGLKSASSRLLEGKVPALPRGYRSWQAVKGPASKVSGPLAVAPSTRTPASGAGRSESAPKTATLNSKTISAKLVKRAGSARTMTLGSKVRTIMPRSFKGSAATALVIKTGKLTRASVSKCLSGSKVRKVTLRGAATKKRSLYRECFSKRNCGKKVHVV